MIERLEFPAGATLVTAAAPVEHVYFLLRGALSVAIDGRRPVVRACFGDLVGVTAVTAAETSLQVLARTPVEVLRLPIAQARAGGALAVATLRRRLRQEFGAYVARILDAAQADGAVAAAHVTARRASDREQANAPGRPGLPLLRPGHRPHEEELTILFSDIRSFATLAELMSSADTFDFLNSYMARMEPCITRHGGYIDKLIGDAIMAVFRHADDAVAAACAMEDAVTSYNRKRLADGRNPISSGIGINTGLVMRGLLGTIEHLDPTVIGDAVNLASRLEALTKLYGVRILVSDFTHRQLGRNAHTRLIDRVRVKGREAPVGVHEVFDFGDPEVIAQKAATREEFRLAFDLYLAGRFADAAEHFRTCCTSSPRDLVSRVYVARCEYLHEHPPEGAWDGIFQKRAARFDVGDVPGRLYFEHALHDKVVEDIFIRNVSETGALVLVGLHMELYIGERVLVEFVLHEPGGGAGIRQSLTCQVRRGTPGTFDDGRPCWQYGIEFYEMTWAQHHALRRILPPS